MRILLLSVVCALAAPLFAASSGADAPLSSDGMKNEASVIIQECRDNEVRITALVKQAVSEKDIRWKLCLDDTAVTARGVAASAVTAEARMGDLIGSGKPEPAKAQYALLRGLGEASKKAVLEAQSCRRQLTKVSDGSEVKKELDRQKSGSCGPNDGINDAMCVGYTDDFVTERPQGMDDDPLGTAGTDQVGGSYETPWSVGEDSGAVQDNFQEISNPPFAEVSAEK